MRSTERSASRHDAHKTAARFYFADTLTSYFRRSATNRVMSTLHHLGSVGGSIGANARETMMLDESSIGTDEYGNGFYLEVGVGFQPIFARPNRKL